MKYPSRQYGLSLIMCVVAFAIVGFVMVGILMSARYERNLFAETWEWTQKQVAGLIDGKLPAAISTTPAAPAANAAAPSSEIRKCTIKGKVVYSNVECAADNPTSRKVNVAPAQAPAK